MTDEIAAVPSSDTASYLGEGGVTDEEFDSWVKRSRDETDAVLRDWDAGVEFDQRVLDDPPPMDQEIDGELEDVHDPATCPRCIARNSRDPLTGRDARLGSMSSLLTVLAEFDREQRQYFDRQLAIGRARAGLEGQGFVVVDSQSQPRPSGLILPTDGVVAWAKRTFSVPEDVAGWRSFYGPVTIDTRSLGG